MTRHNRAYRTGADILQGSVDRSSEYRLVLALPSPPARRTRNVAIVAIEHRVIVFHVAAPTAKRTGPIVVVVLFIVRELQHVGANPRVHDFPSPSGPEPIQRDRVHGMPDRIDHRPL